jgi:hypothetical protein
VSNSEPDVVPQALVRNLQVVVGALVGGVLIAAVIFFVVRSQGPAPMANQLPLISFLAVGFAAMMIALRLVMIPVLAKAGRAKLMPNSDVSTGQVFGLFASRTIMGAALLEGSAFFFLVAYLVEGQPWALGGGLIMAGLIAVLQFPTRTSVENAIAADRQASEDERV